MWWREEVSHNNSRASWCVNRSPCPSVRCRAHGSSAVPEHLGSRLIWYIMSMVENWFWHDKCLLVSVNPQRLCSISYTSSILGAVTRFVFCMCTVQCGKQKLWSSAIDFTAQPFFIFWMDCVADENHGNFYFCVKYSGFMMKKKSC